MGSGRDKRKKQKGKQSGLGATKTAKKTEKNEEKAVRRATKATEGGEDDIDALLAQFKLQDQAVQQAVVQEDCAPSARVHACFVPTLDQKVNELLMFGGEYYDSEHDKSYVYNDLYKFNCDKRSWARIVSPNGPTPRSSTQAVVYKGCMYMWGGEFVSPNQERFRHFKDLWRLELEGWVWDNLPARGGPTARSGHRMVLCKNKMILFGGFNDSKNEIEFYNDLWELDLDSLKWSPLGKAGQGGPSPRGGCGLALHGDVLYVIGGYCVVRQDSPPALGKRKAAAEPSEKGVAHDDVWAFDLKKQTWDRVKRAGMAPNARSSFGLVVHKNRALMFGGVTDQEGKGDKTYSEIHDELYQFNMDSQRWYPVVIAPSKKTRTGVEPPAEDDVQGEGNGGTPGVLRPDMESYLQRGGIDTSSALYKAVTRIQAQYRGYRVRKAYKTYKLGGKVSELLYSPATFGVDFSAKDMPKPRARTNPVMAVKGNTLWLLGGIVEIAHTDVTLDDMWSLDLNKLDGWHLVRENTAGEEAFKDLQLSSGGEWETDDDEEEDD